MNTVVLSCVLVVVVSRNHQCDIDPLGIKRDSINIQETNGETDTPGISFLSRSYIQVDLQETVLISGIVTQDSPQSASRITHFRVAYSTD
ncbi:hypothetical protein DPMN_016740 [Dreissena polymorpha]|uniref:F5/8 type C domain-containing protein n=1 Tax=Dreissena polymorpha TaxID=45954 RepID=A0A9D4S4U4_DREPO|nr:hypothetical protein DPMN_016740 [Dreissena polymorpha]